jgi:hypothetical protein
MLRKVLWTCVIVGLLLFVAVGAIAAYDYCSQPGPAPTPTSLPEGSFIREGVLLGTNEHSDHDGDWVSDRLEFHEHGTNPLKLDTDDDGIDDFNEIFTYPHLLDPLDPTDAEAFLDMIPNVEAEWWKYDSGDTKEGWNNNKKYINVAKRDPLVQWYAARTTIEWQDTDHARGSLTINGEPLFLEYDWEYRNGKDINLLNHPAYYLTHGRKGICVEVVFAHYPILEIMGYDCLHVHGITENGEGHSWLEGNIDGRNYVINFNSIVLADIFYQNNNWFIYFRDDL